MINNHNKKDLNNALELYELVEYKDYAPIHNSYNMLETISTYYEEKKIDLTKDEIAKVNIGLLAAKALDFDDNFSKYAQALHNVWYNFLTFLGKPYKIPRVGPKRVVYNFYKKHKFNHNKAISHMQGIDFLKDVDVKYTLNKKDEVAQWKLGSIPQGNYYSEVNKDPSCLGINPKQADYQGQGKPSVRIEHIFRLQMQVICLKTISAAVLDTWSIRNTPYQTRGGCIQYFNANDRNHFR